MQRMSVGAVAAAVTGLLVLLAGIWAQTRVVNDGDSSSQILIAYVSFQENEGGVTRGLKVRTYPGEAVHVFPMAEGSAGVAPRWSPDGDKLLWVELKQDDGVAMHFWDRNSGVDVVAPVEGFVPGFYWSPDSQLVFSAGDPVTVIDREGRVVFWEGPPKTFSDSGYVLPSGWSNDSQRIAMRRNDSLVVYDRRSGLRVYSTADFGLPGNFSDYTPLQWDRNGNLPVVLTRGEGAAQSVFVLDVGQGKVVSTITGKVASEYLDTMFAESTRNWIPRRDSDTMRTSNGLSADGGSPILTYFDFATGEPVKQPGVVVRVGGRDVDLQLADAYAPLELRAMLDVVVVGGTR